MAADNNNSDDFTFRTTQQESTGIEKAPTNNHVHDITCCATNGEQLFKKQNFDLFSRLATSHGSETRTVLMSETMNLMVQRAKEGSLASSSWLQAFLVCE